MKYPQAPRFALQKYMKRRICFLRNWTRNERITLRLTKEEKDFLTQKKIEAHTHSYTDLIMKAVGEMPNVSIDTKPFFAVSSELNRIGNNINQLAKIANTSKSIYEDDYLQLQKEMQELKKIVYKCLGVFSDAREGKLYGLCENISDQI